MSIAIYNDISSSGSVFKLQLNGNSLEVLRDGVIVSSQPAAGVDTFILNILGSNTFAIDQLVSLANGVGYNNGTAGTAVVVNASADSETFSYNSPNSVRIAFTDGGANSVYGFGAVGNASLTSSGTVADLVFNLPGNTNTQLEDDGTSGNNTSRVRDTLGGFEQTTFVHPTGSLTINGKTSDSVTLNLADSFGAANVFITAGAIDETGAITTSTGGLGVTATNGNIALDTVVNAVKLVAFKATGTASYRTSTDLIVGTVGGVIGAAASNLTLSTTGAATTITQTDLIKTATLTLATGANGAITLTNAGNLIGTVQSSGTWGNGSHTITESDGGLNVGPITSTGDVSLTTGGGGLAVTGAVNVGVNALALTANGANTITQTQAITAGTLNLVTGGGSVTLESAGNSISKLGTVSLGAGALTLVDSATLSVSGAVTAGGVTLTSDTMALGPGTIDVGTGSVTLKPLTGGRAIDLGAADHAGLLALSNAELNTVTADTLTVGSSLAGDITVSNALTLTHVATLALVTGGAILQSSGSITAGGATLNAGTDITLAQSGNDFSGTVSGGGRNITLNDANAITLGAWTASGSLGVSAGGDITFTDAVSTATGLSITTSGAGTINGIVSGAGGLNQEGTGTTTVNGAQIYTGETHVDHGTLMVEGSIASSPLTTVASGATLGGHGTVGALSVASDGTLSPGASAGTLATGNLSFAGGATFKVELGGTSAGLYDQVAVTGTVNLGGAALKGFLISGFNPELATGAQFVIINNDGNDSVVGIFDGLAEGAKFDIFGSRFAISYHGGDGNDVVLTVLNDPPQIGGDLAIKVAEGGSVVLTGQDLTAFDPDNTDTQLVFTVTGTTHGTVQLNGADATSFTKADIIGGHVSFLHDGGEANGGFSVSLSDGTVTNITASVTATVDPHVNDAPVTGDVSLPSIQVNSGAHLITEAQLLANSSDAEGDTLHVGNFHIETGLGSLADNHNGTWTYTPKINDDTQVSFAFDVTDGQASTAAHAKLDITSAQSAPAIGTPGDDTFVAVTGNASYTGLLGTDTIIFDFKLTEATVTYSDNQIIIDGPASHTVVSGIEVFKFIDGTVNNADGSPLVDDLYYYSTYHDVWLAGADADAHFANYGWKEGRNPDAFFDTQGYLAHNPDVAAAGVNPLTHYDLFGWREGRDPSAIFDTKGYLAAYPDVKAAGVDPLAHFLLWGAQEGRHEVNDGHWG